MPQPITHSGRRQNSPTLSSSDCRLFVESIIDYAVFMLDTEGYVATWNRGAESIKGYTAQEIIGRHFSQFYSPEDVARGKPAQELETARTFGRVEDEGWRVRKDGSRFWANVVITAIRSETGVLRGFGKVTRDLSAKRQADEALRESEQRFHHLVDAVVDYAIFMLDPGGHVSTWNPGAARLKGYSAGEIIGRHFSVFYTAEDRASGKPARILETVRREGRFEEEGFRVKKDGSRFFASVTVTALRDADGELVGFAKVTRDLTARRDAEERERELIREQAARAAAEAAERRVRESEERYRALGQRLKVLFEGVADAILVQDLSGRIVLANTSAARLYGHDSPEGLLSSTTHAVFARFEVFDEFERPLPASERPIGLVLAGSEAASGVLHLRERATGRERWVLARANNVSGGGGEPELVITIWHDVTAERRQERQARVLADATAALGTSLDEREMLTALAESVLPALGDWSSVVLVSDGALSPVAAAHMESESIGATRAWQARVLAREGGRSCFEAMVQKGLAEIVDPDDRRIAELSAAGRDATSKGRLAPASALLAPIKLRGRVLGVLGFFTKDPLRRFDWSHVALAEEMGRRTGVALDNARLYADAQAAAQRAEEANRSKDEFLATVSHELRTPLSAILGWASLLKSRVVDPTVQKPLETIFRNAEAQVKIVEDILDVSRVITGKFRIDVKPLDLIPVVNEALEVVRPSALAKRVALEFEVDCRYCFLLGDADRLRQVIWNLLSNAVKFTDAGGSVTLTLRQSDAHIVLTVRDTGAGIDPAFLPFVFDRFRQADASTTRRMGGLGLGLSIVRHIVEMHGGRTEAASEGLGKGSTFTLTLPVTASAPVAATSDHEPPVADAKSLAAVRVLLIDDHDDAREIMTEALAESGAVVEAAESARSGFDAFRTFRPDVVVSDIGMPGEDGYSLVRRLRALPANEGGNVPAVALTGFARAEDGARALAAGFNEHVGKPVDPQALAAIIRRVTAQRR